MGFLLSWNNIHLSASLKSPGSRIEMARRKVVLMKGTKYAFYQETITPINNLMQSCLGMKDKGKSALIARNYSSS